MNTRSKPFLIRSNSSELKPTPTVSKSVHVKTVAEQAFCDLLTGPVPKSDRDYRRAIMLAALIGRQIEADFGAVTPWQSEPPDKPGSWEIASVETDFEPSPVTVTERNGELWADEPHIGNYPLQTFHDNLIDLLWRKAIIKAETVTP